jgi:hypothetical protein
MEINRSLNSGTFNHSIAERLSAQELHKADLNDEKNHGLEKIEYSQYSQYSVYSYLFQDGMSWRHSVATLNCLNPAYPEDPELPEPELRSAGCMSWPSPSVNVDT